MDSQRNLFDLQAQSRLPKTLFDRDPMANLTAPLTPEEILGLNELQAQLLHNTTLSRSALIDKYLDPRRDIDTECGYPLTGQLDVELYRTMYDRDAIACRANDILPKECYKVEPDIYEDEDEEVDNQAPTTAPKATEPPAEDVQLKKAIEVIKQSSARAQAGQKRASLESKLRKQAAAANSFEFPQST